MPSNPRTDEQGTSDHPLQEDPPIPAASDDKVLDETARLAREGRRDLENDPKEPKSQD